MNSGEKFPKIIHQVWHTMPGGSPTIPDKWRPSQESWIKYHPDHQYILWTNKSSRDYIAKMEPTFLSTYDKLEYEIQRIDAIRYVFLKHMGGIYCDLDLEPSCNITDKIVSDAPLYLIKADYKPYTYRNDFMISKPGIQFWDICLEMIKTGVTRKPYTKGTKVLTLTGPYMINEASSISQDEICHLSVKFSSSTHDCGYFKALGGRSWNGLDLKVYNTVNEQPHYIIIGIILVILFVAIIGSLYWTLSQVKPRSSRT